MTRGVAVALPVLAALLSAMALPDGQQYFGMIRDSTPITTNGYTRAQIDERIDAATDGLATTAEVDAKVAAAAPSDYANVSNRAMSAVQPAALAPYAQRTEIPSVPTKVSAFENDKGYLTGESDPTVPAWAKAAKKPTYTATEVGAYTKAQSDAAFFPKNEGEFWSSWWSGDGFRVTVTNYNVAPSEDVPWSRLPSARFDYRPDGAETNALQVVWDEETKWTRWRGEFAAATNDFRAALDAKASVDWGATTPTGFDAPQGFTWLDTPATVIAGGLSWQKTVTSEGAFWVLSSNGMMAQFGAPGASTNGYFRITDERGNSVFEIVAGDKVTVGADAASVHTWKHTDGRTHLRVVYNVDSAEAPKLYAVQSLNPGGTTDWKEVGTEGCAALAAGWTGQRGAWTNALWLATAPASAADDSLFVCATYERGGGTVVKNHAAVSMEKLVLGGKTYTIGTAKVGGHTVLTLTEAQ